MEIRIKDKYTIAHHSVDSRAPQTSNAISGGIVSVVEFSVWLVLLG